MPMINSFGVRSSEKESESNDIFADILIHFVEFSIVTMVTEFSTSRNWTFRMKMYNYYSEKSGVS